MALVAAGRKLYGQHSNGADARPAGRTCIASHGAGVRCCLALIAGTQLDGQAAARAPRDAGVLGDQQWGRERGEEEGQGVRNTHIYSQPQVQ
jgi:hypothetical protein